MINLVISLLVGLGVWAVFAVVFSPYSAIVFGLIAFAATYVILAQKAMKQLGAIAEKAQKEMMKQQVDRAIETFRSGFALGKKQFLVSSLVHANVGTLLYVKGDFDAARPHLEKGYGRNYLAKAMLGAYWCKKNDVAKMKEAFEIAVKYGKKDGMVWGVYAWCLEKHGQRPEAMKVLARGVEANPTDEKLKNNLLALQNNKKMKTRVWAPQFYQFHLEAPPPEFGGGGRRVVWQRR